MASVLKAQRSNALKAGAKGKRKVDDTDLEESSQLSPSKKKNRQRVLMLSSRGITHRMRHLMNDLEALLPHVKKGTPPDIHHV
jgi:ribosome biogenesis protein BRX1